MSEDVPDVMDKDWALAMGTVEEKVEGTELTVKKARAWSPTWTADGAAGEGSRDEGDGGMVGGQGATLTASGKGWGSGRRVSTLRILVPRRRTRRRRRGEMIRGVLVRGAAAGRASRKKSSS